MRPPEADEPQRAEPSPRNTFTNSRGPTHRAVYQNLRVEGPVHWCIFKLPGDSTGALGKEPQSTLGILECAGASAAVSGVTSLCLSVLICKMGVVARMK